MLALALACGAASVAAEPLPEFEAIVKGCQLAFDARGPEQVFFVDPARGWVKQAYAPVLIRYDVRRTDSLVSPLIAYLEAADVIHAERAADESAARALDVSKLTGVSFTRRINFAYQAGRWEIVDGRATGGSNALAPVSVPLKRTEILALRGPLGDCLR